MNTREFLSLILPSAGVKYLAELRAFDKTESGKTRHITYFHHYPYNDVPTMAGDALALDEDAKHVYFALAGFSEPVPKVSAFDGKTKMNYRTQEQAVAVKCLWADIDCGPEKAAAGDGYATKKEAAQALAKFCATTKTPMPLIVDSGGGLHCYWPFAAEVTGAQWTKLARAWRAITVKFDLRSDRARDIDVASVLRPVGTVNRKAGRSERPVRAMNDPAKVAVWGVGQWAQHIAGLLKAHGLTVQPERPPRGASINDDLVATEYPPSSAVQIASHCSQMLHFYNSGGDVAEPLWRAALGILKHTVEGDALAHEWSSGHPAYDESETQQKLDRWATGPTTCAKFAEVNPDGCAGCKHAGKITSPIRLGGRVPDEPAVVTIEATAAEETKSFELPAAFAVRNGQLVKFVTDADDVVHEVPILSAPIYIYDRIYDVTLGTYTARCMVEKGKGKLRYFDLPTSMVQSNKLSETLSGYEVFMMSSKSIEHVREYLRQGITKCAEAADEHRSVTTFGWDKDMTEFILGDLAFHADGTTSTILPSGNAKAKLSVLADRCGSAAGWAQAVDKVYNRPKMEAMQYAICAGFGSLLAPFVPSNSYHGCLLALTSARSGIGKTTVAQFALYAFGDPEGMTVSGQDGATSNALYAEMSTFNNIPLLLDEFSQVDQKFISGLAYAVIQGQERKRLRASGELQVQRSWDMSPYITANTHLGRLLSADGTNAEAQAVRIMEFSLDSLGIPKVPGDVVREAEELVKANRGSAGPEFVHFMVTNQKRVRAMVEAWFERVVADSPTLAASQYRFFRGHIACTLAAAEVMGLLGLHEFNLETIYMWVVAYCEKLAAEIVENNVTGLDDSINRLVNAFSQQVIVTYGYGDGRHNALEEPLRPIRDEPLGRHIVGGDRVPKQLHGILALSKVAIRQWCGQYRVDYNELMRSGIEQGVIVSSEELFGRPGLEDRFVIGRGTTVPSGQVRCVFINLAKLNGQSHLKLMPAPVSAAVSRQGGATHG